MARLVHAHPRRAEHPSSTGSNSRDRAPKLHNHGYYCRLTVRIGSRPAAR